MAGGNLYMVHFEGLFEKGLRKGEWVVRCGGGKWGWAGCWLSFLACVALLGAECVVTKVCFSSFVSVLVKLRKSLFFFRDFIPGCSGDAFSVSS